MNVLADMEIINKTIIKIRLLLSQLLTCMNVISNIDLYIGSSWVNLISFLQICDIWFNLYIAYDTCAENYVLLTINPLNNYAPPMFYIRW